MRKKSQHKILKIFIIIIVSVGLIITTFYIWKITKGNQKVESNLTYTGKMGNTDINSIWVATFQLVWNELISQRIGSPIQFEEELDLVSELNKRIFQKDMISQKDYYIKVGATSPNLKSEILTDVKNKFNIEDTALLNNISFSSNIEKGESYTLFSMLHKKFAFIFPFDKLKYAESFGGSNKKIQYFGINNASSEELNKNVDVLFYNNSSDFAVRLNTKEGDEVLLYRTNDINTFDNLYHQILDKNIQSEGDKMFGIDDELKIPYINIETLINYDELCGKIIKGTNGLYIQNAIQNVKFSLNEMGGNLVSQAALKDIYISSSEKPKYFYFTDKFVLFIKEKQASIPYFALRVDNTDSLVEQ
ncbi:MAG: hypothetical protein PHP54_04575 [Clostridia bacterium]|nr:hypothetical protein [Clostridia bacterium]